MFTFLLIESSSLTAEKLKQSICSIYENAQVYVSKDVEEGMSFYLKYQPDLTFLDIDENPDQVFEFIYRLEEVNDNPNLVVMASNKDFAIKAIRTSVIDYLLKPIKMEALRYCLQLAEKLHRKNEEELLILELYGKLKANKRIRINTRVGFEILKPEEVLFCKADRNYTDICRTDGKIVTTSNTLGCIERQLPPDLFFRIGRSAIINIDYIKAVNRKEKICELACDGKLHKLPLSPSKVQDLAAILN